MAQAMGAINVTCFLLFKQFFFGDRRWLIKCKLLGESLTDDGSFVFVLKKEPPL